MRQHLYTICMLFITKGLGYFILVLTNPLFASHISLEAYGTLALLWSICNIMAVIIEFGYPIHAVSELATNRNKHTIACFVKLKIVLTLLGLIVYLIVALSLVDNIILVLIGAAIPISAGISNLWIYNGLKQQLFLVKLSIVGRVASLPILGIFLYSPNIYTAACFMSAFWIFPALLTLVFTKTVIGNMADGDFSITYAKIFPVALQSIVMAVINFGTPFYLYVVADSHLTGLFLALERSVKPFNAVVYPIAQYLLPRVNDRSIILTTRRITKIGIIIGIVAVIASLLFYLISGMHVIIPFNIFIQYLPILVLSILNKLTFDLIVTVADKENEYLLRYLLLYGCCLIFITFNFTLEILIYGLLITEFLLFLLTMRKV